METLVVFVVSVMLHTSSFIEIGMLQDRVDRLENTIKSTQQYNIEVIRRR